ncbi:MAG TPA: acyl-CoA dehydrogenase [Usitatibacter sp.]|jgi:alkylation response protein AidB-like acyl-CoA dehydrogenase|nr:acyl-CoA dehydrogenase [Usitatibacter sp.]
MDFSLAEERRLLQDTIRRFLANEYSFDKRRARVAGEEGFSRGTWKEFARLGLAGIAMREEDGGLGGDAFDTLIVMESFGRALVAEPYLATVVLGAGIIADAGNEGQRAAWLPGVSEGDKLLAFAHGEPGARYAESYVATRAVREGSSWKLDGRKSVVLNAQSADAIVVSARSSGKENDRDGISLFLVDPKAKGVSLRPYATQDGGRAAEVELHGVAVSDEARLGEAGHAMPAIDAALDRANAALCAEALGVIDALNEATLEYLKTRKQFGQPIGRFQALQHRMAEMTIKAVEARSMAILAAAAMRQGDARERSRRVSAAKAFVGQASRFVGQQAVQMHGAIGVTDELIVSHWFKRLTMINATFGDADHHLGRFSDLLLTEE